MSENPFKIIRATDEPPESLRNDVIGSVRFLMLIMRFAQLFVADYAAVLFNNVRTVGPDGTRKPPRSN